MATYGPPSYASQYDWRDPEDDPLAALTLDEPVMSYEPRPTPAPATEAPAPTYTGGQSESGNIPQPMQKTQMFGPFGGNENWGTDYQFRLAMPSILGGDDEDPLETLTGKEEPLSRAVLETSPQGVAGQNATNRGGGFGDASKDPDPEMAAKWRAAQMSALERMQQDDSPDIWESLATIAPGVIGAGLSLAFNKGKGATEALMGAQQATSKWQGDLHQRRAADRRQATDFAVAAHGQDNSRREMDMRQQQYRDSLAIRERELGVRGQNAETAGERESRLREGFDRKTTADDGSAAISQGMVQAGWDPQLLVGKSRDDLLQMAKTPPPEVAERRAAAQRGGAIGAEHAVIDQRAADGQQMAQAQASGRINAELAAADPRAAAAAQRARAVQGATAPGRMLQAEEMDAMRLHNAEALAAARAEGAVRGKASVGPAAAPQQAGIPGLNVEDQGAYDAYLGAASGNRDKLTQTSSVLGVMNDSLAKMEQLRASAGSTTDPELTAKYEQLKQAVISSATTLYQTGVMNDREYARYSNELPPLGFSGGELWKRTKALMPGGASPMDDPNVSMLRGGREGLGETVNSKLRPYGVSMGGAPGGGGMVTLLAPDGTTKQFPAGDPRIERYIAKGARPQ